MREKVVGSIMKYIKAHKSLNNDEEEKIIYGLESIYILVTKLIIISIAACLLHIFKEMVIFLLLFSIIRSFGFGMHASKGYICMIISLIAFIGLPYLAKYVTLSIQLKIIFSVIFSLLLLRYCPADTKNRPIINPHRRKKLKYITFCISIIYSIISLITNSFISNCLLFSLLLEVFFASPLTYKLFKLPYNNYLTYLERDENNVLC